jgi:hypothetical protein
MYLVYLLPLFLIVLVALAIFTGPVLAVIVFVLFLAALGVYKFLARGTDPEHASPPRQSAPPANAPDAAATASASGDEDTGMWGEKWPEQESSSSSS